MILATGSDFKNRLMGGFLDLTPPQFVQKHAFDYFCRILSVCLFEKSRYWTCLIICS